MPTDEILLTKILAELRFIRQLLTLPYLPNPEYPLPKAAEESLLREITLPEPGPSPSSAG